MQIDCGQFFYIISNNVSKLVGQIKRSRNSFGIAWNLLFFLSRQYNVSENVTIYGN